MGRRNRGADQDRGGIARASSIGIEIGVAVIAGLLGGRWADEKLGTSPWLLFLGVAIGSALGLMIVLKTAKALEQE